MLTVVIDILALQDQSIIPSLLTFLHAQHVLEDSETNIIISSPQGSSWVTLDSQEYSDIYPPFDKINQLLIKGISNPGVGSHNPLSSALSLALCGLKNHTDPRILVISFQNDMPSEYIPVMNCIFAAQKSNISIDVLRYSQENSLFLSQAAFLTHGYYYQTTSQKELIQVLFSIFIVPQKLRSDIILPNQSVTDLRPLCFCHKKTLEMGHVCTICLSIYCTRVDVCESCGTKFT
jgi:transcription initiation factor TFIIH subunit 3